MPCLSALSLLERTDTRENNYKNKQKQKRRTNGETPVLHEMAHRANVEVKLSKTKLMMKIKCK